jgi:hypothetical protein
MYTEAQIAGGEGPTQGWTKICREQTRLKHTAIHRPVLLLFSFILSAIAAAGQVDITTWQANLQHTGANLNETILTPQNVSAPGSFGMLFT